MADEKSANKATKPINDVEQPDTRAASSTSKPVIVSNRPLMKDPMVVEEKENEDGSPVEPKENLAAKGSSKTKIQPLESSPKPEAETKDDSGKEKPAQAEEVDTKDVKTADIADAAPTTEETKKPDKSKTPADNEDAEAARKAERDANLQKIVDAKTYYLPINSVEKRKTKRFVLLGIVLSILLALVWVDIALDAGLVQVDGISPVTHFFSS